MDWFNFHIFASLPLLSSRAYLDPGSGSVLIQLLIAGLLGAAFILKASWSKIKAFFSRSDAKKEEKSKDDQ
jgi:hypothetical protein